MKSLICYTLWWFVCNTQKCPARLHSSVLNSNKRFSIVEKKLGPVKQSVLLERRPTWEMVSTSTSIVQRVLKFLLLLLERDTATVSFMPSRFSTDKSFALIDRSTGKVLSGGRSRVFAIYWTCHKICRVHPQELS